MLDTRQIETLIDSIEEALLLKMAVYYGKDTIEEIEDQAVVENVAFIKKTFEEFREDASSAQEEAENDMQQFFSDKGRRKEFVMSILKKMGED